MRPSAFSATLLVMAVVGAFGVRVADACTPPGPGIRSRGVLPPDGATSVPTNARLVVVYGAYDPSLGEDLELRTKDGVAVPLKLDPLVRQEVSVGMASVVVVARPMAALKRTRATR
jgi:hypothetical protein